MDEQGIAAIILAAGASRRFGESDKLWHEIRGVPLIEHAFRLVHKIRFSEVVVVGTRNNDRLQELTGQYQFGCIQNRHASQGMGTSIRCGIDALNTTTICGVAIFLGDMPFLELSDVHLLWSTFISHGAQKIVRPSFDEQPGHPVFFPKTLFGELSNLVDDTGAKSVIQRHARLLEVVIASSTCIQDVDTTNDLPGTRI